MSDDPLEKCMSCKHCYTRRDDDYIYCRKRNGKCEYKPYESIGVLDYIDRKRGDANGQEQAKPVQKSAERDTEN